jgi:outer membrane protein assembly factor BamB
MATDGQRAFALFANGDMAAFDFEGKQVWTRSFGVPDSSYGLSSSLAVWRNLVFVLMDQGQLEDGKAMLYALDAASGKKVWEQQRPVGSNWTSPIVANTGKGEQLVTVANPWVIAYDPEKGKELWKLKEIHGETAPSPIVAGGLAFAVAPNEKMVAIKTDGQGDVSKTKLAWETNVNIPDICSPVSNGDLVFMLTTSGALTCFDVKTGKLVWEQYLDLGFRASPSLVGDKLFLLSQDGIMFIATAARQYKLLGKAKLGEECHASPAFADGRIYLRGTKNLYCIGK